MAKAGVIGVQMRAAHRPLAKTDEGVAKCTRLLCGQTSSGSWGSRKAQRHVETGWQASEILSPWRLLEDVFRQSTKEWTLVVAKVLATRTDGPNGCTAARQSL